MLIKEFLTYSSEDIILESDEFILKSVLDAIILDVKNTLEHNKGAKISLDRVISELNLKSDSVYIDPMDEDRRNNIMQSFEEHGMDVERGSGDITLQHADIIQADSEEQEKERQSKKVASKAMDKIKKSSKTGSEL